MKYGLLIVSIVFFLGIGGFLAWTVKHQDPLFSLLPPIQPPLPTIKPRSTPYLIYGYLPYWTRSNTTLRSELTHISYFSLTIQGDGTVLTLPKTAQDPPYRAYHLGVLTNLRSEMNPAQHLELTLTMMDDESIRQFLQHPEAQTTALTDIQTVLTTQPIDGINIDVEYSGEVDSTLQEQFQHFMQSLHTLQATHPFHLSVATYADAASIPRLNDPGQIAPYVDHIVVMTYDFHRRSSPKSGPVAPIYGGSEKKWDGDIVESLKAYTDKVPAEKILLGIPFYGYEWSVVDTDPQSFTLPKSGSTATYKRVKELMKKAGTKVSWDPVALSPYLQYEENGQQKIIYYEDETSLSYKLDLVKQADLGGIAIWALGYEGENTEYWDVINKKLVQ